MIREADIAAVARALVPGGGPGHPHWDLAVCAARQVLTLPAIREPMDRDARVLATIEKWDRLIAGEYDDREHAVFGEAILDVYDYPTGDMWAEGA